MPRFEPFPGVRYDTGRFDLADVTAPPYDVIDGRRSGGAVPALEPQRGPHRPADRRRRRRAATTTPATGSGPWRPTAPWSPTSTPSFYRLPHGLHRRRTGGPPPPLGVIGALELVPPRRGRRSSPTSTPRRRPRATGSTCCGPPGANLSPVWGLSLAHGLTALLAVDGPSPTSMDRRRRRGPHALAGRRPDRAMAAISERGARGAGGHRRRPPPLRDLARLPRRAAGRSTAPAARPTPRCASSSSWSRTSSPCGPIHRLLSGLPDGYDLKATLTTLGFSPGTTVTAEEVIDGRVLERMATENAIALVTPDGRADLLTVDDGAFDGVADLDSARVAHALAQLPRPPGQLPARHRPGGQGGGQRRSAVRAAPAPGAGGPDRGQRPRRRADAAQDDVLPSEAQDRRGVPVDGRRGPGLVIDAAASPSASAA